MCTLFTKANWESKCRWLAEAGVKMASEKEQRHRSKELVSTAITGEIAPFTHSLKKGGEEVKSGAMAYTLGLWDKIAELLEQRAR